VAALLTQITKTLLRGIAFALACTVMPVNAQELLQNRSFESPVVPANGNNFYATIPNWTATNLVPSTQPLPFNVIRPFSGYANNPTTTPTGGAIQYLDINSAAGNILQTVVIPSQGLIDFSGWFSVRDGSRALSGMIINIRNSSNVVVSSVNTSFVLADPVGLWKIASASNIPINAGTYTFEAVIPDFANFDLASLVFKPAISVSKTSITRSDPISVTNPKSIPGSITEYSLTVTTPASYSLTTDSIALIDTTPANTALIVSDFAGIGSGPANFTAGSSTLTYNFLGLSSTTDDIEFSNNNGLSWTYVPVVGANNSDPAVTSVRLRPKGTMVSGSTLVFKLRYLLN
jgi:hypothetical protein